MASNFDCNKLLSLLETEYQSTIGNPSRNKVNKYVKYICVNLKFMNRILRAGNLTVGDKQRWQSTIVLLKSLREKFKQLINTRVSVIGGSLVDNNASVASGSGVQRVRNNRIRWESVESAFQNRIKTGVVINISHIDLKSFLSDAKKLFHRQIRQILRNKGNDEVNGILYAKFETMKNGNSIQEMKSFNTRNEVILPSVQISDWYENNIINPLSRKIEEFQERDSGWALIEIINLVFNINKYEPIGGGSISTFIKLPDDIIKKLAVVNIKNNDEYCFLWCIKAAMNFQNNGGVTLNNDSRVSCIDIKICSL